MANGRQPRSSNTFADTNDRLRTVEVEVQGMMQSLGDIQRSVNEKFRDQDVVLDKIQQTLSDGGKINWGVLAAGIIAILALWAAAIHPLDRDIERQRIEVVKLNDAATIQNRLIDAHTNDVTKLAADLMAVHEAVSRMDQYGTTGTAAKVGYLEGGIRSLSDELARIRDSGSPITDRRLAVLEYVLKVKNDKP